MNVYGSARRRLWPQVNTGNAAAVRRLDFINRLPRHPVAERRVRRAAKEKECRALMVSRLRHNSTSSRSSGRKVARLPPADHGQAPRTAGRWKEETTRRTTPRARPIIILAQ